MDKHEGMPRNPMIKDYGAFLIREHFRKDTFSEELERS